MPVRDHLGLFQELILDLHIIFHVALVLSYPVINFFFQEQCEQFEKKIAFYFFRAIGKKYLVLEDASDEIKDNQHFVLSAVKQNGLALEFTSNRLRDSKEVVFAAVKQNGLSLKFASERLRDDKDIVLVAIKQNGLAYKFAVASIVHDEFGLFAQFTSHKFFIPEINNQITMRPNARFRNDKSIAFAAVSHNGLLLEFASDDLKDDIEVYCVAVKQNPAASRFGSQRVQCQWFDRKKDRLKKALKREVLNSGSAIREPLADVLVSALKPKEQVELLVALCGNKRTGGLFFADRSIVSEGPPSFFTTMLKSYF